VFHNADVDKSQQIEFCLCTVYVLSVLCAYILYVCMSVSLHVRNGDDGDHFTYN